MNHLTDIFGGFFILSVWVSILIFDRLAFIEYKRHHKWWIKDGKPLGRFWRPKGIGLFQLNIYATNKFYFGLLRKASGWAKKDKNVLVLIRILKFCLVFGIASWVLGLLSFFIIPYYQATHN